MSNDEFIELKNTSKSINGYADTFRNRVNEKLKNYDFKTDVLAIINALLLGQRQDISPEIYNNYVNCWRNTYFGCFRFTCWHYFSDFELVIQTIASFQIWQTPYKTTTNYPNFMELCFCGWSVTICH